MKRSRLFRIALFASSLALFVAAPGQAGPVGALIQFHAGEVARSADVNANFSDLRLGLNDNAQDIDDLETAVAS